MILSQVDETKTKTHVGWNFTVCNNLEELNIPKIATPIVVNRFSIKITFILSISLKLLHGMERIPRISTLFFTFYSL